MVFCNETPGSGPCGLGSYFLFNCWLTASEGCPMSEMSGLVVLAQHGGVASS